MPQPFVLSEPVFELMLIAAAAASATAPVTPESSWETTADNCYAGLHGELLTIADCQRSLSDVDLPILLRAQLLSATALQYARIDNFAEAESLMGDAVQAAPDDLTVVVNSGNLAVLQRRYQDALLAYERALLLSPAPLPQIHLNRSLALRGMGRYDQARLAYETYQSLLQAPPPELEIETFDGQATGEIVPARTLPEPG